jgi:hypothetical protein
MHVRNVNILVRKPEINININVLKWILKKLREGLHACGSQQEQANKVMNLPPSITSEELLHHLTISFSMRALVHS